MKMKKSEKRFLIVLFGAFLILLPCIGQAEIPGKINYQGYLTSAAGVPVNGTVAIVFTFYTVATGGSSIWSETQNVTVNKGVYNVNLGDVTPMTSLPFGLPYYLGIQVGTDPQMTPRIPLTSVGYAFRAKAVETIGSHTHSGSDITSGIVAETKIDSPIARDSEVTAAVNAHALRTDNPHSTTAGQVGAVALNQANSITSGMIVDGTITPADVGFNYAGSSTKGGPATDLNCTGCVSSGDLIDGAVTKGKLNATGGGTSGQVLGTDGATLTWLPLGVKQVVYGTVNGSYSNQDMGAVSGTGFMIEPAVVNYSYVGVKITFSQPFPNTPTCVVTPFQTDYHAHPCSYWHPADYYPGMQLNYFLVLCRPQGASDAAAMVPFSFMCVF
jgi:hypothetical protein